MSGSFATRDIATELAHWAHALKPSDADLELSCRALIDTAAVGLAARQHPINRLTSHLDEPGRWAVAAHVLDYDDMHLESTTHISAVCVPATLATGGEARAYLAGAGVMARLGTAMGWQHYVSGWHATCTAGAPAAAVAAGVAMNLSADQLATAMALAVPAAGGVQRAFGTDAKSLQVGLAVDAGVRAARLAAAGATADPRALDAWLSLMNPAHGLVSVEPGPAVPGGLAIKIYPACYAMQRPINALGAVAAGVAHERVSQVVLRTPECTVQPLIHHQPRTGLEGKFSLEYAVAVAVLDGQVGMDSFTDEGVRRPEAVRLMAAVQTQLRPGGNGLLEGEFEAYVHLTDGSVLHASQSVPPGAPTRPPSAADLAAKVAYCLGEDAEDLAEWTWAGAAARFRAEIGAEPEAALAGHGHRDSAEP
jgi:2-methylcitrate dehydratase PrpD